MQPKVHQPSGYEAHFGTGSRNGSLVVDGLGTIPYKSGDNMRPSFVAAAGKPFTVTIDPARISKSAEKVELVWYMAPTGEQHAVAMSDGSRNAAGQLNLSPAKFDVPVDAVGTMRLSIRSTDAQGKVSSSWDPTSDALVAPASPGSTLVFSDDWKAQLDTPLHAGEKLQLVYDADRASALFGGQPAQNVTAVVQINGNKPQEFPLTLKDGSLIMPTLPLPLDATNVSVWFKGERDGNAQYDSAFGKNFHFDVGPARDDADISWKNEMLKSTSFPSLKADQFVGIGPSSQRYNCIAWTLGIRDEWVWPGTTVKDFDALYAKSGFKPLDSMDTSLDPKFEKVVIYGNTLRGSAEIEVTHGARQDPSGEWTSKLGTQPLIRHKTLENLVGPSYGEPVRVYVRPRQAVQS